MTPLRSLVAWIQAVFYAITGIWPLVSRSTFERVTGPKTDFWLVKTVGLLITVIGVVLGLGGSRGTVPPEIPVLGIGSAASLAAVDVVYVRQGLISRVYLLDVLAEVGLIALWVAALAANRRRSSS